MNEQAFGPSRRDPRPGEQALIVQLAHNCGRNLARVRYSHYNSLWTPDSLVVFPNINVRQETYRPRDVDIHHAERPLKPTRGHLGDRTAGSDPREGDWRYSRDATNSWHCRCGEMITRRHDQISRIWERELSRLSAADKGARGRVVRPFVLEA